MRHTHISLTLPRPHISHPSSCRCRSYIIHFLSFFCRTLSRQMASTSSQVHSGRAFHRTHGLRQLFGILVAHFSTNLLSFILCHAFFFFLSSLFVASVSFDLITASIQGLYPCPFTVQPSPPPSSCIIVILTLLPLLS